MGSAHPDEVAIVSPWAAVLRMGGRIARIYARTMRGDDAISLAKRVNLQLGCTALALPAGGHVTVFYTGPTLEVRGGEALAPAAFALLNVAAVVLGSVYERRREIFTLASIGLNPTHIFLVFLSEAVLLGFTGGALGLLSSYALLRAFQVAGLAVPVDVKAGLGDALLVVSASTAASVAAAVVPALKASTYATPSLRRRWRLEAVRVGEEWVVEMPARIPADKAHLFVDYVAERFSEERGIEVYVDGVSARKLDGGFEVRFTYNRGGNRPFRAYSRLLVEPRGEFYAVKLATRPVSVYARFTQLRATCTR